MKFIFKALLVANGMKKRNREITIVYFFFLGENGTILLTFFVISVNRNK